MEDKCLCNTCNNRFKCWTTKRVYSNPEYQALYEAFIAVGSSHEEAVRNVKVSIIVKAWAASDSGKRVKTTRWTDTCI